MDPIVIQLDDPAAPDVRPLIEQLDEYQIALYPPESNHLLPIESLRQPGVIFLSARRNGQVVGCGAVVDCGAYAELKRMYVLPELRGQGVARRLLAELEARARAAGLTVARLETGVLQPEAVRLYEKAGYQRRGPFGPYPEDPLSIFMEKRLA